MNEFIRFGVQPFFWHGLLHVLSNIVWQKLPQLKFCKENSYLVIGRPSLLELFIDSKNIVRN